MHGEHFSAQVCEYRGYIAYFSTDKLVLESLLQTLDGLFSKASDWELSDDTRDLMIGLATKDQLQIESQADVTANRLQLMQRKIGRHHQ